MRNIKCKYCKKTCDKFELSKECTINHLIKNDSCIHELLVFYEYLSPNTSSNLSFKFDNEKSEKALSEMLKKNYKEDKNFIFLNESINDDLLDTFCLKGEIIKSSCKRFICSTCPQDKSNRLTSLMRHIRNSIAHARFYIIKSGNYYKFLFEDIGKYGKITFRMVINHSDLKKWKKILISYQQNY